MANAHGASILVRALHGGAQGNLHLKTIVKTLQRLVLSHPGEIAVFIQAGLSPEHTYPASA